MSSICVSVDAFDTEQLLECMGKLKSGQSVNVPIYDFKNHRRCSESFRKVCHQADSMNVYLVKMTLVDLLGGSLYIIMFFPFAEIWMEECYLGKKKISRIFLVFKLCLEEISNSFCINIEFAF